jgi:hypothetical protein
MTSIPIEILGKVLAESRTATAGAFDGLGATGSRKAVRGYQRAVSWLLAALGKRAICAHGFTKGCPTCAHFAKVRQEAEQ